MNDVLLVRHAKAGRRGHSVGPDRERRLTRSGRRQADALAVLLGPRVAVPGGARPTGRVVSSPYPRCVETVEPLAHRLGVVVELDDALAEGRAADGALGIVGGLGRGGGVVCSHGDVIGELLLCLDEGGVPLLDTAGRRVEGLLPVPKGGTWVLEHAADGSFSAARLLPAPR